MSRREAVVLLGGGPEGIRRWNAWRGIEWRAGHPQYQGTPEIPSLEGVDLAGAHIRDAELLGADLSRANLRGADLTGSDLFMSRLAYTDLRDSVLRSCQLGMATLLWTRLENADLTASRLRATTLNCDLSQARGIESMTFFGATSVISPRALELLGPELPPNVLHACGYSSDEILQMQIDAAGERRYFSCFISYSQPDHAFAHALHGRLEAAGVPCWFAPHDMRIGDKIRPTLHDALSRHEKLLLVLSEHATRSQWVEVEVEAAFEHERLTGELGLVPVRLDDSILKIDSGWAADVRRTRHIGDFSGWHVQASFTADVDRLLRDLRRPDAGVGPGDGQSA